MGGKKVWPCETTPVFRLQGEFHGQGYYRSYINCHKVSSKMPNKWVWQGKYSNTQNKQKYRLNYKQYNYSVQGSSHHSEH